MQIFATEDTSSMQQTSGTEQLVRNTKGHGKASRSVKAALQMSSAKFEDEEANRREGR